MSLPVALHSKLEAALVADEGFDASVRSHVLVQQGLSQVGLVAELALEGSLAGVLVLPHVVQQVTFSHELLLADVALEGLLSLVFNPAAREICIQRMKLSENFRDLQQLLTTNSRPLHNIQSSVIIISDAPGD